MNRSGSALNEGLLELDTSRTMVPSNTSFQPPYAHYALIYLDSQGRVRTQESSMLQAQDQNSTLFTAEVCQNFLKVLDEGANELSHSPRRREEKVLLPYSEGLLHGHTTQSHDGCSNNTIEIRPLRIGEKQELMAYYEDAFGFFQQLNCRTIARAFIRFIEPRKQVNHPYCGKRRKSSPRTVRDPEKTKPRWWPSGVKHKEPDHLQKKDRVKLLIHLVRNLGGYGITADHLKEVAGDSKRSLKHPSDIEVINEILAVRKMEERFECGEVDASIVIHVMDRRRHPKNRKTNVTNKRSAILFEEQEDSEQRMSEASSIEQKSASNTPIIGNSPPSISQHSPLRSFPELEPLRNGILGQHSLTYCAEQAQSLFLNNTSKMEMAIPNDISVYNYSACDTHPNRGAHQIPISRQNALIPPFSHVHTTSQWQPLPYTPYDRFISSFAPLSETFTQNTQAPTDVRTFSQIPVHMSRFPNM